MNEFQTIYPPMWVFIPEWGQPDVKSFREKYNTLIAENEHC